MLVQRLDGAVAVVVRDGEDEHVTVCPVDGPGITLQSFEPSCIIIIIIIFGLFGWT